MVELRKRNDNNVVFVDPYVVYKYPNPPRDYKPEQEKNLMMFLVDQCNKKDILFPYNFK
jgi:hypothetical protein